MTQDGVSPPQGKEALDPQNVNSAPDPSSNGSDDEKRSNFKKVKDRAEREEEGRKKAEAERDTLLKEKADREAADKVAQEKKLAEEKRYQELAEKKQAEAEAATKALEDEKRKSQELQAQVKAIEDQQEAELTKLLEEIPEDKRPPLDTSDPVKKRLEQVKYAHSLLASPKSPVGAGARNTTSAAASRKEELLKKNVNLLTKAETAELMGMTGE